MTMVMQTVRQLTLAGTIIAALSLSVLHPDAAIAATYYAATNGNDASSGTQAQPFRTIKKGLSVLAAGDTLYIRGGTYDEVINSNVQTIPTGTTWSNAPIIASYPGETAILRPSSGSAVINLPASYIQYLILDRLTIDAFNTTDGISLGDRAAPSHHIRFQNGEVKNARAMNVTGSGSFIEVVRSKIHDAGHGDCVNTSNLGCYGFYWGGTNSLFDGNEVYNNGGYGFHIYHSGGNDVINNIVRNNVVYGNGFSDARLPNVTLNGILIASGGNNIAYNNIVYGNANGMRVSYTLGGSNNQLYNNTIYGNTGSALEVSSSALNTVVRNNICYGNGSEITNWGDPGAIFSNNFCGSAGTGCALSGDPQFVNAASRDFRLQAGSPARNAGVTLSTVSTDYQGVPRPQEAGYDIGAFEYQPSSSLVSPAPPTNVRVIR